jgi:hypothetical protein
MRGSGREAPPGRRSGPRRPREVGAGNGRRVGRPAAEKWPWTTGTRPLRTEPPEAAKPRMPPATRPPPDQGSETGSRAPGRATPSRPWSIPPIRAGRRMATGRAASRVAREPRQRPGLGGPPGGRWSLPAVQCTIRTWMTPTKPRESPWLCQAPLTREPEG